MRENVKSRRGCGVILVGRCVISGVIQSSVFVSFPGMYACGHRCFLNGAFRPPVRHRSNTPPWGVTFSLWRPFYSVFCYISSLNYLFFWFSEPFYSKKRYRDFSWFSEGASDHIEFHHFWGHFIGKSEFRVFLVRLLRTQEKPRFTFVYKTALKSKEFNGASKNDEQTLRTQGKAYVHFCL